MHYIGDFLTLSVSSLTWHQTGILRHLAALLQIAAPSFLHPLMTSQRCPPADPLGVRTLTSGRSSFISIGKPANSHRPFAESNRTTERLCRSQSSSLCRPTSSFHSSSSHVGVLRGPPGHPCCCLQANSGLQQRPVPAKSQPGSGR